MGTKNDTDIVNKLNHLNHTQLVGYFLFMLLFCHKPKMTDLHELI